MPSAWQVFNLTSQGSRTVSMPRLIFSLGFLVPGTRCLAPVFPGLPLGRRMEGRKPREPGTCCSGAWYR